MIYEKRLLMRLMMLLMLLLLTIIVPACLLEHPLLLQVFLTVVVLLSMPFIQKRLVKRDLERMIRRYGVEPRDDGRVQGLIDSIENIFENSRLSNRRLRRINRALELSIEINHLFLKSNDQQSVYDFILEKALEAIEKTSKGSILLLNDKGYLNCISLMGFDESFKNLSIKKEDDFLYKTTDGKVDRSVIIEDVVAFNKCVMTEEAYDAFYEAHPKKFQTVLSTPIKVDDTFIGVLNIDGHKRHMFDKEDIFIMDLFASQLEVAIRNRNLLNEILFLSRYDHLTNAYNRKFFDEIVDTLIERCEKFAYVIIDINDLKKVNDGHGHSEGDQLLKIFSNITHNQMKTTDYLARLGGDEFGMILIGMDDEEATELLVVIKEELDEFVKRKGIEFDICFSHGITVFPKEASTAEELYLKSDQMMYQMKRRFKC